MPCTIQTLAFADLLPSLVAGQADAIIAGLAITAEARETVAFSGVYLQLPARFVARTAMTLEISASALSGRTIAVIAGSAHEAYLTAFFPGAVLSPYPTAEAARAALRAGLVDVAFGDGLQLAFWLQGTTAGNCCVFAGGPYLDRHFFGGWFAIAVRPEATGLRRALDAALEALHARGVYAELTLRYFPLGFY